MVVHVFVQSHLYLFPVSFNDIHILFITKQTKFIIISSTHSFLIWLLGILFVPVAVLKIIL